MKLCKIISGGQTGADRGGLDAAIELDIEHGGWCPKGRRAEDGRVPPKYDLRELTTVDYGPRTRTNIEESDGTAIFVENYLTPGSRKTVSICSDTGKPYVIIRTKRNKFWDNVKLLQRFFKRNDPATLNVAGTRESKALGIQRSTKRIIMKAIENIMNDD